MKMVELTRGLFALVDDEDFDRVSTHKWHIKETHVGYRYACRNAGWRGTVFMHRFIISAPKGLVVDHINGNGLDNRKINLRVCTQAQNMCNRKKDFNGAQRFKGVSAEGPRFRAQIGVLKKVIRLGVFDTDIEAARAYDTAAKQFFGPFARLNFPEHSFSPPTHLSAETNKCLPACGKVFP